MNSDDATKREPVAKNHKTWSVGTLTYTTGGLTILFCWLLWGDFAWSMRDRAIGPVAQLMLKRFEAKDLVVGLLLGSIPLAIAMVLGPVISVRSDRHRGRFGRRIPFILATTPFAALGMMGLAFTPRLGAALHDLLGASSPGLNASCLLVFCAFWALFEIAIAIVIANAVFTGLVNDVVPQALLGRFFGMFRAVSLLAGIIFNYWLMGKAETHYFWIFIGVALLYGVGVTSMCLKVREGGYPPPPPLPKESPGTRAVSSVRTYFRECFTNPFYVFVFIGLAMSMVAFLPVNAFSVFYAKSIDMSMAVYGKYIALTYVISFVLAYFMGSLADRFHPLRVGIVAIALNAAICLWGWFMPPLRTCSGSYSSVREYFPAHS